MCLDVYSVGFVEEEKKRSHKSKYSLEVNATLCFWQTKREFDESSLCRSVLLFQSLRRWHDDRSRFYGVQCNRFITFVNIPALTAATQNQRWRQRIDVKDLIMIYTVNRDWMVVLHVTSSVVWKYWRWHYYLLPFIPDTSVFHRKVHWWVPNNDSKFKDK